MEDLRLILLLLGLVLLGLLYLWERRRSIRKEDWDLPAHVDMSGERVEPDEDKPEDEWDVIPLRASRQQRVDETALEHMRGLASVSEPLGDDIPTLTDVAVRAPVEELPELVMALTIIAPRDKPISGPQLLDALHRARLSYGARRIYHRMLDNEPLFSLANILEPGYFDLANMDGFSTPGLVLFMRLPGRSSGTVAFAQMLETAQLLAKSLNARVCDQKRTPLTEQAITALQAKVRPYTAIPGK